MSRGCLVPPLPETIQELTLILGYATLPEKVLAYANGLDDRLQKSGVEEE